MAGGERVAIFRVRAEAADRLDVAHRAGRHELRAGLPAGAEDADGPRVLAGEIFDAETVGGADAHALHDAVGQDRQRLAGLHREQQHQSDIAIVRAPPGTFSRRMLLPRFGHVMMSELMRTAPTPSFGTTPSIDLRL